MDDRQIELMISCVHTRAAIWQFDHPDHKKNNKLSILWDEIVDVVVVESKLICLN